MDLDKKIEKQKRVLKALEKAKAKSVEEDFRKGKKVDLIGAVQIRKTRDTLTLDKIKSMGESDGQFEVVTERIAILPYYFGYDQNYLFTRSKEVEALRYTSFSQTPEDIDLFEKLRTFAEKSNKLKQEALDVYKQDCSR